MGNQFLAHIRDVDALIHVLRCFPIDDVSHPEGSLDPARDAAIVETELILADITVLERRREKLTRLLKTGDPKYKAELEVTDGLIDHLYGGHPARTFAKEVDLSDLLTGKPVIYAANVAEDGAANPEADAAFRQVEEYAEARQARAVPLCATLEAELAELPWDEQRAFLKELGLAPVGPGATGRSWLSRIGSDHLLPVKGPETAPGPSAGDAGARRGRPDPQRYGERLHPGGSDQLGGLN